MQFIYKVKTKGKIQGKQTHNRLAYLFFFVAIEFSDYLQCDNQHHQNIINTSKFAVYLSLEARRTENKYHCRFK